jgi:hypothetical protein
MTRVLVVAVLVLGSWSGVSAQTPSTDGFDDWELGDDPFDEDGVTDDPFGDPLHDVQEATEQQIEHEARLAEDARRSTEEAAREQAEIDALLDAFDPDLERMERALQEATNAAWLRENASGFFSGSLDVGVAFLRPRLSFGWGFPHRSWFGADVNPIVSPGAVGAYGGLRLDYRWLDIRAGVRYQMAFRHSALEPRERYNAENFEIRSEERAITLSYETEVTAEIPAGPGWLLLEGAYTYVSGVPQGLFVYEEAIKVILAPPHVWRARGGYQMPIGITGVPRVALVMEVLGNPGRDLLVYRAGLLAKMQLFNNLQLRIVFLPPVHSRDSIGINAGDFGFGIRYRWARVF